MPLFSSSKSRSNSWQSSKIDTFFQKGFSRRTRSPESSNNPFDNASSHPSDATPNDAPPAYTPKATTPSSPSAPSPMSSTSDSAYAFLTQFDTVFLIDDSGSMRGRSWKETENALAAIAPICTTHDSDGIDIYFLNQRNEFSSSSSGAYNGVTSTADVHDIFKRVVPRGGTPTGTRLNHILKPYMQKLQNVSRAIDNSAETAVRPLNIIVITDGIPSDDVESVIVNAARKLDKLEAQPWQVGIQFFQVGNQLDAAEDLQELDDNLSEQKGVRDMVDTVPWNGKRYVGGLTADGILKVVLGAVHKKYDRRDVSGRRRQQK